MPRPAHEPTALQRTLVRQYAEDGISHDHIAAAIGISDETLRKYYRDELDVGTDDWKAKFEQSIKRRVLDPECPPALVIFTAKVQLGWRELTPKDPDKRLAGELTDEELAEIVGERARDRRERGSGGNPSAAKRAA